MAKRVRSASARNPGAPARTSRASKSAHRPSRLRSYHIDAFASHPMHGNPAAVVMLDAPKWLPDDVLQAIAAEHHLPVTAFVLSKAGKPGLRWFSPSQELEICGHGTLAAAHVLWNHEKAKGNRLTFSTRAGDLRMSRAGDLLTLDLPAATLRKARVTDDLCAALGHEPSEVYEGRWIMAVFENKRDVHEIAPDMPRLAALGSPVIITAPGAGHDFVTRYFSPATGLNEDYVTGSAHCALVPYWAARLEKRHLTAHQVSHRPGESWCELAGKRVLVSGHAVTFGSGTITV